MIRDSPASAGSFRKTNIDELPQFFNVLVRTHVHRRPAA